MLGKTANTLLKNAESLTCNRYFLEEFESLNTHYMETQKLSYV